jgi:putative flippase GtrA
MDGHQVDERAPAGSVGEERTPLPHLVRGSRRAVLLQLVVFAGVGGVFNVLYGGLFWVLREGLSAQWANAVALVLSTLAGTWGHRRVTFGVRGRAGTVSHQTLGLAMLAFGLAVTAGSLWVLHATVEQPSRLAELLVLAVANLGVGLVRFAAFRSAMVPKDVRS